MNHDAGMNKLHDRRTEEKERRREEIVQAADDLAFEKGWDNVTVDGVAKRARLSRALVYLYFKDKSDLHAALWERACDTLYQRFQQAVDRHPKGYQKLVAIGMAYVAFAQEMPHYFEAVSRFEACPPTADDAAEGAQRAIARHRRVHELMVATIEYAKMDGSVRADAGDANLIAVTLWGFTHGIIQIVATKGQQLAHEGICQSALIEHAFSMVERSLSSGSG